MSKQLLKYYLFLLTILLGGYGQLHADVHQDNISTATDLHTIAAYTALQNTQHDKTWVILPEAEGQDITLCEADNETEEDKLISKKAEINNYFTTAFYTNTFQYFCCNTKKRLSLHKQSYYFIATSRYIIFRVLRI